MGGAQSTENPIDPVQYVAPGTTLFRSPRCEINPPEPGHEVIVIPVFVNLDENGQLRIVAQECSDIINLLWFTFTSKDKEDTHSVCRHVAYMLDNMIRLGDVKYESNFKLTSIADYPDGSLYQSLARELRTNESTKYENLYEGHRAITGSRVRVWSTGDDEAEEELKRIHETEIEQISEIKRLWAVTQVASDAKNKVDTYAVVYHASEYEIALMLGVLGVAVFLDSEDDQTRVKQLLSTRKNLQSDSQSTRQIDNETAKEKNEIANDLFSRLNSSINGNEFIQELVKHAHSTVFTTDDDSMVVQSIDWRNAYRSWRTLMIRTQLEGANTDTYRSIDLRDVYKDLMVTVKNAESNVDTAKRMFDGQLIRAALIGYQKHLDDVLTLFQSDGAAQKLLQVAPPVKNFDAREVFRIDTERAQSSFVVNIRKNVGKFMKIGIIPRRNSKVSQVLACAGIATAAGLGAKLLWQKHEDKIKSGLSSLFGSLGRSREKNSFAFKKLIPVITSLRDLRRDLDMALQRRRSTKQRILGAFDGAIAKLSAMAQQMKDESSSDSDELSSSVFDSSETNTSKFDDSDILSK